MVKLILILLFHVNWRQFRKCQALLSSGINDMYVLFYPDNLHGIPNSIFLVMVRVRCVAVCVCCVSL